MHMGLKQYGRHSD